MGDRLEVQYADSALEHPSAYREVSSGRRAAPGTVIGYVRIERTLPTISRPVVSNNAIVQIDDTVTFATGWIETLSEQFKTAIGELFVADIWSSRPLYEAGPNGQCAINDWRCRLVWRSNMLLSTARRWPHRCVRCGSPAQHMFSTSECSNAECPDFSHS